MIESQPTVNRKPEHTNMLQNLHAEITRYKVNEDAIAESLGINKRTLQNKLIGDTQFKRNEMYIMRDEYFPTLGVEYLFHIEPEPITIDNTKIEFEETT